MLSCIQPAIEILMSFNYLFCAIALPLLYRTFHAVRFSFTNCVALETAAKARVLTPIINCCCTHSQKHNSDKFLSVTFFPSWILETFINRKNPQNSFCCYLPFCYWFRENEFHRLCRLFLLLQTLQRQILKIEDIKPH